MKRFSIYKNAQGDVKAVKIGWNWPAFILTWIYLAYKKLWKALGISTGIYLLVCFVIGIIGGATGNEDVMNLLIFLANIGYSVIIGLKANDWIRNDLKRKGYEFKETIEADTPEAAINNIFKMQANTT